MSSSAAPTYDTGNLRGVPYAELPDSMRFEISGNTATGIRRFRVAWANRFTFVKAVLGEYQWINGELTLFTGAQAFPGYSTLSAKEVNIEGEALTDSDSGGQANFTSAIVTVKYLPTVLEESRAEEDKVVATEEMDFAGEFMLAPEGSLKWGNYYFDIDGEQKAGSNADAGKLIQQQSKILTPTVDLIYTKRDLKDIPKTTIQTCLGKVNSKVFPKAGADGGTFGVQTVLFVGGTARRQFYSNGSAPYELTLVFKYRKPAWNLIYQGKDTSFPWSLTSPTLYQTTDLSALYAAVAQ